eukprot:3522807-Prymnesium_polylepis.1
MQETRQDRRDTVMCDRCWISHARAQYCCSFHAGPLPFVCAATARCPPHMTTRESSISLCDRSRQGRVRLLIAHPEVRHTATTPTLHALRARGVCRMGMDGGLNEKSASAVPA